MLSNDWTLLWSPYTNEGAFQNFPDIQFNMESDVRMKVLTEASNGISKLLRKYSFL